MLTVFRISDLRCCFCLEAFVSLYPSTTPLTSCSIARLATRKASIRQTQSRERRPLCYLTNWRKRIKLGSGLREIFYICGKVYSVTQKKIDSVIPIIFASKKRKKSSVHNIRRFPIVFSVLRNWNNGHVIADASDIEEDVFKFIHSGERC